jgi:hypothetical protein
VHTRRWLPVIVAGHLLMPGLLGLHVHPDGTCHAHPVHDDHHEHGDDPHGLTTPDPGDAHADCRPAWFDGDASPDRPAAGDIPPAPVVVLRPPPSAGPSVHRNRPPGHDPPRLYLTQRHLLL